MREQRHQIPLELELTTMYSFNYHPEMWQVMNVLLKLRKISIANIKWKGNLKTQ